MNKFLRKIRAILISILALAALLAIGGGFTFLYYADQLQNEVRSKIDEVIQPIATAQYFKITYEKIHFELFDGIKIANLNVVSDNASSLQYNIKIPKIDIQTTFSYSPKISIKLKHIQFSKPIIEVEIAKNENQNDLSSTDSKHNFDINNIFATIHDQIKKQNSEYLYIPSDINIYLDAAQISLIDHQRGLGQMSDPLLYQNVIGTIYFDLNSKRLILDLKGDFQSKQEKLALKSKIDQNGYQINISFQNFKVKRLSPLVPPNIIITSDTNITGDYNFFLNTNGQIQHIDVDGTIDEIGIEHWRLAEHPVNHIKLNIRGRLIPDLVSKRFEFKNLRVGSSQAHLLISGFVDYSSDLKLDANFSIPKAQIQDILETIPKDFIPIIHESKVAGTLAMDFDLKLDMAKPNSLVFDPKFDIENYKLIKSPTKANIHGLKDTFHHIVKKAGKIIKEFDVGRKNKRFVPYTSLGRNAVRAVLTCEDGRFFSHNGFQLKHFRESIIENLKAKRFVRGASTITMQLAKNLFLNGNKNISRKFQEILLAYALEQELDKKRMLEIYMNIIEWGPQLYGIRSAASHYFHKHPSRLSPMEAAFLGSIIANPVRYHYMYNRGSITGTWATYLSRIVSKMHVEFKDGDATDPYNLEFGWVKKKRIAEDEKDDKNEPKKRKGKKS